MVKKNSARNATVQSTPHVIAKSFLLRVRLKLRWWHLYMLVKPVAGATASCKWEVLRWRHLHDERAVESRYSNGCIATSAFPSQWRRWWISAFCENNGFGELYTTSRHYSKVCEWMCMFVPISVTAVWFGWIWEYTYYSSGFRAYENGTDTVNIGYTGLLCKT